MLFGISEEDIAYYGLIFGLTGLMGFMCFIIYKIGRESKAGKFGMFALFIVLGLGMVGFVAKSIIARWLGI
jgi:hypothetical membrane protein